MKKMIVPRVLTKNQCLAMVSGSKKKPAPARPCAKKSEARVAIQLKMLKPAPDLRTKSAIACWMKRPTMTVGQGMAFLLLDAKKKPVWKMSRPRTEMARSP